MKRALKTGLILLLVIIYSCLLSLFYLRYVPLIHSFQMALIPLLLAVLVLSTINIEWGILCFVFLLPLINNLPYFFGIDGSIPHAPTALILFLALFLGWLLNVLIHPVRPVPRHPILRPLILFSLIVVISGLITFLRFANFFPFLSDSIHELIVNVNGVRAGGALMSTVFNGLNYLSGFAFFLVLLDAIKTRDHAKKVLFFLFLSTWISLIFAYIQRYVNPELGNTQLWLHLNRINGTFKDPNSFGVYLSALIPLMIGVFLYSRWRAKICIFLLILLSVLIFPSIGSRSALLGLIGSASLFFLLSIKGSFKIPKLRPVYMIGFFLVVVLVFLSLFIFFDSSVLSIRIEKDLASLTNKDYLPYLFTRRLDFWAVSVQMMKEYPLSGVGLGAYIIELPGYLKQKGLAYKHTDSAENYFFHLGSELGLIGLLASFWLLYEIIKFIQKGMRGQTQGGKERFIYIGAVSGIFAIFINLTLHSYIGSYEVKYFFWFLFSIVCIYANWQGSIGKGKMNGKWLAPAAALVAVVFGGVHFWNSAHSLSIIERTKTYGWDQNFGIYSLEKDEKGEVFFWTKRTAGNTVDHLGDSLVLPIRASHPNIARYPVKVSLYAADEYFKRKDLVSDRELIHNDWVEVELRTSALFEKKIHFIVEASRAWQPSRHSNSQDPRWLGIGMRRPWFRYADKAQFENAEMVQSYSYENWEGEQQDKLWSNGVSHMNIEVEKEDGFLCLNLRGEKAHNIGPYIIVRLDGNVLGKTMLTEEGWVSLVFEEELEIGEHEVAVEFINNYNNSKEGDDREDRNVYLGDIEIITGLSE